MMKKQRLLTLIMAITVGLFLSGCGKDGEIGPEGPAGKNGTNGANGPTGPTGPTGSTGGTGATGPAGTANVIYSPWITIPKGQMIDNLKYYVIPAPELTKDIIDKAAILTFYGAEGSIAFPLPLTEGHPNGGATTYFVSADANQKKFDFYMRYIGSTFPANWATTEPAAKFRYVIIPGAVKTSISPNVNLNDYEQVKKYFKIL